MLRILARTIQISRGWKVREQQRGFTLLEVLIVVALVAIIAAIAVPTLGVGLKINIDNASRGLSSFIRTAYDESILTGNTYRLAFNLEKKEYWAESGDRVFLLRTEEQEKEHERVWERIKKAGEENPTLSRGGFSMAKRISKNKRSLPSGVQFVDIITPRNSAPQTKGIAYVHIYPHGFIEKLIIHLKDTLDRQATLVVDPVNGKSRIYNRYLKDDEI